MTAASVLAAAVLLAQLHQGSNPAQGDFAATVRAATERYRDRAVAIADGYRKVGADFPSMGEHWVSPSLVLQGTLDPARPQVLEYGTIGGQPTLLGVAFAALTTHDDSIPLGLPVPRSAWHAHAGTLDEESYLLSHAEAQHRHHDSKGPRITIVHVWAWLSNPGGLFETDNWALPFARLGLAAPDSVTPAMGRAAALVTGGDDYFRAMVRVAGRPDSAGMHRLSSVLDGARARVRAVLGSTTGRLTSAQATELQVIWEQAWSGLLAAATGPVRERLLALQADH